MEQHQVEYMKRNYPTDWQSRTMTSYDTKMAHMVNKIREKYKQVYDTRPHTVLIEHKALIQQATPPKVQQAPQKVEPAKKENKQPVVEETCRAITISTNKVCGRKAKSGGFCGLHCKKQ
jgi:hypothetical protein